MAELLRVEGLSVRYRSARGPVPVLDAVDLAIRPGEVVGLVGESGCGKSTLARAILGILPRPAAEVTGGAIRFHHRDLLAPGAQDAVRGRAITFVPQDPFASLHPLFPIGTQARDLMRWTSPRRASDETTRLHYSAARQAEDRAALLDMLREVQLPSPEQALGKLPHQLSGGQRQRLLIALALLPQPDLIIADEPTTALDVTIQAQILRLLHEEVRRRGVSVLFTTHDLGVASEICDRIVVMYAGQEAEAAPAAAFFAQPRHPYTAALLASVPRAGTPPRGIPGEVPRLLDPPPGCRFAPRCARAAAACAQRPRPREILPEHRVCCHHPLGADA